MSWSSGKLGGRIVVDGYIVKVYDAQGGSTSFSTNQKAIKRAYWRGDKVVVEFFDGSTPQAYDGSWWSNA